MRAPFLRSVAFCTGLWLGSLSASPAQQPESRLAALPPPTSLLEQPAAPAAPGQAAVVKPPPAPAAEPPSPWEKVPPVRIFPRVGNFSVPPSGPGYYSIKDCIEGNFREAPPRYPYPAFGLMQFSF